MNERLILMTKRVLLSCVMLSTAHAEWEQLPPLPEPNGGFMSGVTNGKIVIVGGTNWEGGTKNWLKAVHEFDPKSLKWDKLQDCVSPIAYGLSIQRGLCFSFVGGTNGSTAIRALSVAEGKKTRFMIDELPDSMVLLAGGHVKDQYILVGGTDDAANLAGVTRSTHALARFHDRWQVTRLADYPGKPFATAASAVVGGEQFVFGGMNWDEAAQAVQNTTAAYAFDPAKNAWRTIRPLATPVRGVTAVALDDHRIYIAGGYGEAFTTAAVIYDVKTDSYRKARSLPYAAMVALVKCDGFVYCLGGEDKMKSRTDKFFRIPVAELLK
jgi:N-acetylneuraminic acid mutarotase